VIGRERERQRERQTAMTDKLDRRRRRRVYSSETRTLYALIRILPVRARV